MHDSLGHFALPSNKCAFDAPPITAQAYQRLGKLDQAREALEAGIKAGKGGGDVMLYVELVQALSQLTTTSTAEAVATKAPVATAKSSSDSPENASRTHDDDNDNKSSSKSVGAEHSTSGSPMPAPIAQSLPPGREDGSGGEGDDGEDGGGEDDGSVETTGQTGEEESGPRATGRKKKKKKKKKKAAKTTWEGEENGSGGRLTLTANKESGGGVLVKGLSGVLAASDISPVLLEAARAQLCHAVGDPDIDNLIALGYLQVLRGVSVLIEGACCLM